MSEDINETPRRFLELGEDDINGDSDGVEGFTVVAEVDLPAGIDPSFDPGPVPDEDDEYNNYDPRSVPVLTEENPYEAIYQAHIAEYGEESLRPQTLGDLVRTSFYSALLLTSRPEVMMALMVGGNRVAKGLSAWWANAYFNKGIVLREGLAQNSIIGDRTDEGEHLDMGEVSVNDLIQYGIDHFAAVLRKEE